MQFQRINREDAERIFAIFYNCAGAAIAAGQSAVLDVSAPDGVRVSKPAAATLSLFVGVATQAIADGAYGKFQVYGYKTAASVINHTTQAIAAGDILLPVDAQWYLARSGASSGVDGLVMACEAVTTAATPAAADKKVFIRAL